MPGADLDRGVALLEAGGVIAYPTDTVFGLGARIDRAEGVARILQIKGRDPGRGMPVLVADRRRALVLGMARPGFAELAGAFWPGPLTLLLPTASPIDAVVAPGGVIGLRVPDHGDLLALLDRLPTGIIGTSANRSGSPALTSPSAVRTELGSEVDWILPGRCRLGEPSSVVDLTVDPPLIRRVGALAGAGLRAIWPALAAEP
ncbi:MAG: threonylcarbamoyl-AMP synthase [Chloroflexi bacterium]|nr:threonylcarbamoyl-AMP synthase [Chloroflexota bacterium]MYC48470.1 threonylcarbamoyl-AMP synthase [Chloroflexota bacterium]